MMAPVACRPDARNTDDNTATMPSPAVVHSQAEAQLVIGAKTATESSNSSNSSRDWLQQPHQHGKVGVTCLTLLASDTGTITHQALEPACTTGVVV